MLKKRHNPLTLSKGGKPKVKTIAEKVQAILEASGEDAANTITRLVNHPDEKVALDASKEVLNRVAPVAKEKDEPLRSKTTAELIAIITGRYSYPSEPASGDDKIGIDKSRKD